MVILGCSCIITKAQDSINLYKKIENQLDPFRIWNESYYYNPANMQDYSNISFSNIRINHQSRNQELYLLQNGKDQENYRFNVNSYKATKNHITLWGNASYTYTKTKNIRWNNNLDLNRIAPYVIADAVGGDMNIQTYAFKGGVSKNIQKFTLGTELQYQADLGYKTTDPRPKNTTSDLTVTLGSRYKLLPQYNLGLAVKLNRYIQTSSIQFSSEIEQTKLYHMNGLGTYHHYFSNRSSDASYEDFTHQYMLTLGSNNKLFFLSAGMLWGNLSKDALTTGQTTYQSNSLAVNNIFATANKTLEISPKIKVGGKVSYHETHKKGTEVYYTNINAIVEKLLEKETYREDLKDLSLSTFFEYKNNHSLVYLEPFYRYTSQDKKKIDINSQEIFKYHFIGAHWLYQQHFYHKNILSLNATFYMRRLDNKPRELPALENTEINQWLNQDFLTQKTNYKAIETSIRYDRQLWEKHTIFAKLGLNYYSFANHASNKFYHLSLGFTF